MKFPAPWKFVWKDYDAPKVVSANGSVIVVLSTGTINGPYDPEDIVEIGKLIEKIPDIFDIRSRRYIGD